MLRYDVISIGCMRDNLFFSRSDRPRPSHATTTLIRDGANAILVDPSLPGAILEQLLWERAGLTPGDVQAVFLTTFRPTHRGGLDIFDRAEWLIGPAEREFVIDHLGNQEAIDADPRLEAELGLAGRLKDAPDKLSPQVSLFPAGGASPGSCALLLTPPTMTIAVAGDAIIHAEYFYRGAAWQGSADLEQARESLAELVEIADLIIPGHDNLLFNPKGRMF